MGFQGPVLGHWSSSALLHLDHITFASGTLAACRSHHARKAEKLITLIAIPAYDPISIVNIILIISCPMDVCVIKACFRAGGSCKHSLITPMPILGPCLEKQWISGGTYRDCWAEY